MFSCSCMAMKRCQEHRRAQAAAAVASRCWQQHNSCMPFHASVQEARSWQKKFKNFTSTAEASENH